MGSNHLRETDYGPMLDSAILREAARRWRAYGPPPRSGMLPIVAAVALVMHEDGRTTVGATAVADHASRWLPSLLDVRDVERIVGALEQAAEMLESSGGPRPE